MTAAKYNRRTRIVRDKIEQAQVRLADSGNRTPTVRELAEEAQVSVASAHKYGQTSDTAPDLGSDKHLMPAKFPGKCSACGDRIEKGEMIVYDHVAREVQHTTCAGIDSSKPQAPQQAPQQDPAQAAKDKAAASKNMFDAMKAATDAVNSDQGAGQDAMQAAQDALDSFKGGDTSGDDGEPGEGDSEPGDQTPSDGGNQGQGQQDDPDDPFTRKSYVDGCDTAMMTVLSEEFADVRESMKTADDWAAGQITQLTVEDTRIEAKIDTLDTETKVAIKKLKTEIDDVRESGIGGGSRTLDINIGDKPTVTITETTHEQFDLALSLLSATKYLWLGGPAGGGKSFMSEQLAKALDLDFYVISCTQGMLESKLEGKRWLDGEYQYAPFVRWAQNGGVFLADEFDAMNDNVRLLLNSAIASRYLALPGHPDPDMQKIPLHEDCYLIIGTNTWGNGADAEYTGRDTIDMATRDRFNCSKVFVGYDRKLEKGIPEIASLGSFRKRGNGEAWKPASVDLDSTTMGQILEDIRAAIARYEVPGQLMSTRVKVNMGRLLAAGVTPETALSVYFTGWDERDRNKVTENIDAIRS